MTRDEGVTSSHLLTISSVSRTVKESEPECASHDGLQEPRVHHSANTSTGEYVRHRTHTVCDKRERRYAREDCYIASRHRQCGTHERAGGHAH
jgi:hypothetical protein